MKNLLIFIGVICLSACIDNEKERLPEFSNEYLAHKFDFPVGKPDAEGYYNAQLFGENSHLGEDWNKNSGGNTDLGDTIYSIANGYVSLAKDIKGGWGKVIRIIHKIPNGKNIESLYAHCDTMFVKKGDWVERGEKIGTIGNVNGMYLAHLHFEIRNQLNLPIGGGYSSKTDGFVEPTKFIKEHR